MDVEEEQRKARSKRVASLRAQWRKDRAAGKIPPREARIAAAHPPPGCLLPGIPHGCTGRFLPPKDGLSMLERGEAIAFALERVSAASDLRFPIRNVDVISLEEACSSAPPSSQGSSFFFDKYARQGRPVVVQGCTSDWKEEALTPTGLAEVYGDSQWTCRSLRSSRRNSTNKTKRASSPPITYHNMTTITTTLGKYLDELEIAKENKDEDCGRWEDDREGGGEKEEEEEKCGRFYGANNRLPDALLPCIALPSFFPPRHAFRREHTRLWIGGRGGGVHCHRDLQDNFVVMIFGRKRFDLWAPHMTHSRCIGGARAITPYLHEAICQDHGASRSETSIQDDKEDEIGVDSNIGGLPLELSVPALQDPPSPSPLPIPPPPPPSPPPPPLGIDSEDARMLSVVLEPGDCLYLPAGWWHAAETLENPGASINFFCAATYCALGVVPPNIFPSDWPVGFEPA